MDDVEAALERALNAHQEVQEMPLEHPQLDDEQDKIVDSASSGILS